MNHFLTAKTVIDFLKNDIRQNAVFLQYPSPEPGKEDATGAQYEYGQILGCESQSHAKNLVKKVIREQNPRPSIIVVLDDGSSFSISHHSNIDENHEWLK